jgi:hypothetical protein
VVRDLNMLTVGYKAPATDWQVLRNDMMSLVQGGIRPPSAAVLQLSERLIDYLPRRQIPLLNTERLALDLEAVMNGSHLNAGRVDQAISSALGILRSSGVPQVGVQAISTQLRTVGIRGLAINQPGLVF